MQQNDLEASLSQCLDMQGKAESIDTTVGLAHEKYQNPRVLDHLGHLSWEWEVA